VRIATLSNASVVHTRRWVEHFRGRGHEVGLWSLEPGPRGFECFTLPRAPLPGALRYPLAVPALTRALSRFAPDLVDAHFVPNYGLLGTLAGRRPLAVTAWGSDLLTVGAGDSLRGRRARFVLERADAVLVDSGNLGVAARALGAAPERLHVIPWGVDRTRFRPAPPREPGLLVSARMHERIYDLPTLIAGVKPVLERHPEARLAIAGDGTLRGALERLARATLPAGRYEFLGRLEPVALAGLLGRAGIHLSASLSDSTSVSLLEAMASGAVPVVSDIDGNREWVGEGEGARLFPPGDPDGVTRALERALPDPGWLESARARNLSVIAQRGDWDVNLGRIESLFEALVAAARGAATPARIPARR
jgi:glycosyltransferase involved in cell wall biosynthesis